MHYASWVDDLIFIMSTPEHGDCAGSVGGCPVCTEYHGRALKVQELWHAKARKLNIPPSAKGHPVGQSGAFTGVAIDSFQGQFSMLPDKMASLVAVRQELAASEVSIPGSSLGSWARRCTTVVPYYIYIVPFKRSQHHRCCNSCTARVAKPARARSGSPR